MNKCKVADCTQIMQARGMCQKHYRRWRQYGDPERLHDCRCTEQDDFRIIELRSMRKTRAEIAQTLGKSKNTISSRIQKLMREGRLPPLHSPKQSAQNAICAGYKSDACEHGRRWLLTNDEFGWLINQDCHYCGQSPTNRHSRYQNFPYTGIDRINNDGDYTFANVVPCCSICNYAKRSMSQDEFLGWVRRVYLHNYGYSN